MSPQRGMKRANSTGKARNSVKPGKTTKSKEQPAAKKAGHTGEAKKSGATAALPSIQVRIAEAKKLETLDRAKVSAAPAKPAKARAMQPASAAVSAASSVRNSDFPNTYISQISVRLDDPDHSVALTWTGPQAAAQETGPFRSSPGAGLKGLNCDDSATSRRSGSKCTPKGTFVVSGFQGHLNSDSRATYVTWFARARGIGLHYFPSVPKYPASHGCVRLESKRVAQLIQSNSRVDLTNVVIEGTWIKPPKQW
jgi:L,D-transpeptidase catalytic domain